MKTIALFIIFLQASPVNATEPDSTFKTVDTSVVIDSITGDTLTAAQQAQQGFEQRYKKHKKEHRKIIPPLSMNDSLIAYLLSPRFSVKSSVDRSFYHDAADYFNSEPSFFVLDWQRTPSRTTVQPFGLAGNRLNLIVNGIQLQPFEHMVEPDGLADLNDLPTALDHDIFIVPGPLGQLLGGSQSIASLITVPRQPEHNDAETAIIHDRGSFEYNYTRGMYARNFTDGRHVDLGIGYRNVVGDANFETDDVYYYTGEFYQPLKNSLAVKVAGQVYDRGGSFQMHPELFGEVIHRDKFDRNIIASIIEYDSAHTRATELAYHHRRSKSNLSGAYYAFYNVTDNLLTASRQWTSGRSLFKASLEAVHNKYQNGFSEHTRVGSRAEISFARLTGGFNLAATLGTRWAEEYRFLPMASIALSGNTDNSFLLISVGYSERAPTLPELFLNNQSATLYNPDVLNLAAIDNYNNRGNEYLKSEKQLVGNAIIEFGSVKTSAKVNVTAGKISDGIDWRHTINSGSDVSFSPVNGDIDFADASLTTKLTIANNLRIKSGGAYHWIDNKQSDIAIYQPEYQVFSGMELHHYWKSRLLHLYAYGEFVYVGPYDGIFEKGLGEDPVFNAKLSFRIKSFRMHFVFQNLFSEVFQTREYNTFPGRYNYFGIIWNFNS